MGETEVGQFLQHLALNKRVAASTQNQALNGLLFLYRSVLSKPLGKLPSVLRAKRPKRLPNRGSTPRLDFSLRERKSDRRSSANGASGTSDMAGRAGRVAVERSGSCRDTRRTIPLQKSVLVQFVCNFLARVKNKASHGGVRRVITVISLIDTLDPRFHELSRPR